MTTRSPAVLVLAVAALTAAAPAQSFAHNRLDFGNRVLTDRDDEFPDQATPSGSAAGDALFKVLPAEICERQGDHRISGYRMAIAVQKAYAGFFPTRITLPAVQVFRTKVSKLGGPVLGVKEYETADLSKPLTGTFDPISLIVPKGSFSVEVKMDPAANDPKLRQLVSVPALVNGQRAGLAIVAYANPGQSSSSTDTPTAVMRPTYQERHIGRARDSYSGRYTKRTGAIEMYGMLNTPSPRGELALSLLFDNPTLTMFGSTAGGLPNDPAETRMGAGAFATDAATASALQEFGFFAHGEQYQVQSAPQYAMVPMIVSFEPGGPTSSLALGQTHVRLSHPAMDLGILFRIGAWGWLDTYRAGGAAGFARDKTGAWASLRFPVQPDPSWKGQVFWVQGVVADSFGNFLDTTNVVRISLD